MKQDASLECFVAGGVNLVGFAKSPVYNFSCFILRELSLFSGFVSKQLFTYEKIKREARKALILARYSTGTA
ncbi:hypothetical protein THF1C08_80244 [Vibrio jasicida]|uniref:Uncharacterized protein n=1 Tax=Vibrio jasicida TaxID=766224 RepID=A0AAU9QYL3_9VIBR|nr:hypothetical protein THF1C08_80244 [Vibrio jasicida]CAH1603523.1 hypothetical protein THF1A12_70242 [Vibrio jasicida]